MIRYTKEIQAHGGKDIFVKQGAPKGVAKAIMQNVLIRESKLIHGNFKGLERLLTGA